VTYGIKLRPKSNHRKTIEFTGSTKHYSKKHKRSLSGIELIPVLLIRIENALVFISLVEIMELAIATSFDHNKLHQKIWRPSTGFKNLPKPAYNLAKALKKVSESIENGEKYISEHNLITDLHDLELAITNYENGKDNASGVLMLTNMHYAEKQVEIKTKHSNAHLQPLSNHKT
jgi:hypothetical protein